MRELHDLATVLSVSTIKDDRDSLKDILRQSPLERALAYRWILVSRATLKSALSVLRRRQIPVVREPDLWRTMLTNCQGLRRPWKSLAS